MNNTKHAFLENWISQERVILDVISPRKHGNIYLFAGKHCINKSIFNGTNNLALLEVNWPPKDNLNQREGLDYTKSVFR